MLVDTATFNLSYKDSLDPSSGVVVFTKVYHVIMMSLALVGNSIILWGSTRYNAIDLDKVSLVFIESLAITDMFILSIFGVPMATVLFSESWRLGPTFCYFQGVLGYAPIFAEILIVAAISIHRLVTLVRPFHVHTIRAKHARVVVSLAWVCPIVYVAAKVGFKQSAFYDPRLLLCNSSGLVEDKHRTLTMIAVVMFTMLPFVVNCGANITMFIIAWRANKRAAEGCGKLAVLSVARSSSNDSSPNSRNLMLPVITVMAVCFVFNVSVIPLMVRGISQIFHLSLPPLFFLFQMEIFFVSVSCNAIVYTCTCASFRTFTGRLLHNSLTYYSDRLVVSSMSMRSLFVSCSSHGHLDRSPSPVEEVVVASTEL